MMTQIGRMLILAPLLGLLALTPTRASAATLVPFQATVYEHFTVSLCVPATACIAATGTGQATHLSKVTEYASVRVDISRVDVVNGCNPESRSTVLVAANGDEITMSATGWSCSATNSASDSYVVTGGTGRFQDAFGSGTDGDTNMITGQLPTGQLVGVAVTTFSGNLSSPGLAHMISLSERRTGEGSLCNAGACCGPRTGSAAICHRVGRWPPRTH